MKSIVVIGDVHGKLNQYFDMIEYCNHSVQVGDMGYRYELIRGAPHTHIWFPGNHDNYNLYKSEPNCIGDYGTYTLNGIKFFFIRGAFSIDKLDRIKLESKWGKTWFEEEQLSQRELGDMIELYEKEKPDFVLSHDCPSFIAKLVGKAQVLINYGFNPDTFKTATQCALDLCFQIHKPKLWIFGHYHNAFDFTSDTRFMCLPELAAATVYEDLTVEQGIHTT